MGSKLATLKENEIMEGTEKEPNSQVVSIVNTERVYAIKPDWRYMAKSS